MPDIIRQTIVGVARNKFGRDTRKVSWYVEDEDPISYSNCIYWQEKAGYPVEIHGMYSVRIRLTKRKKWQATWNCLYKKPNSDEVVSMVKVDQKFFNHSKIKIDKRNNFV